MTISILYFSGTGNTEIVANLIAKEFNKHGLIELFRVEDILLNKVEYDIEKYDIVGIGYPIYGFNPPFNIFKLIKALKNVNNKKVFIFSTCAGPLYLNDIASYGLKRKIQGKGYSLIYEKQFYMPANIAVRYKDEVIKQLYDAAVKKVKVMVDDIYSSRVILRDDGIIPLFFRWSYLIFDRISLITVPLDFKVLNKCSSCGKCINQCPQRNIKLNNNKIKFGLNCLACYRCVYNCPQMAITGRLYKLAIFKDGYNIKSILENGKIDGNYITKDTKGYYKVLYKYLNE